jgi:hypothetical protein
MPTVALDVNIVTYCYPAAIPRKHAPSYGRGRGVILLPAPLVRNEVKTEVSVGIMHETSSIEEVFIARVRNLGSLCGALS